jgi:hypothetical protein
MKWERLGLDKLGYLQPLFAIFDCQKDSLSNCGTMTTVLIFSLTLTTLIKLHRHNVNVIAFKSTGPSCNNIRNK